MASWTSAASGSSTVSVMRSPSTVESSDGGEREAATIGGGAIDGGDCVCAAGEATGSERVSLEDVTVVMRGSRAAGHEVQAKMVDEAVRLGVL